HSVSHVERDCPEFLDGKVCEARAHVGPDFGCAREALTPNWPLADRCARQRERAAKPSGLGGMDAGCHELRFRRGTESFDAPERREDAMCRRNLDVEYAGEKLRGCSVGRV